MSKQKYSKGKVIKTLSFLTYVLKKHQVVYFKNKVQHYGFIQNLSLHLLERELESSLFSTAVPKIEILSGDKKRAGQGYPTSISYSLSNNNHTFHFSLYGAEYCQCEVCGKLTNMTSTKLCDSCWEIERRC